MKKKFLTVMTAVVLFLGAFLLAVENETSAATDVQGNDLELILDCSGSMAGMVEGKSKMSIAKESLVSVINQIPEGINVGFRAYGHQTDKSQKDCKDSELIYPVGPVNKSQMVSKINSLSPKGWTPIDYSLRQAQNDFPSTSEMGKMIILVSDGEETCGGDPCQAVKDMQAAGFDVTVNTVGFDVGDVAEKQLKCIADATGGEYKSARNASELTESLRVFSRRAFQDYTTSGGAEAGTGFANAPLVESGTYGGDILPDESKFYKISVKKGQEVTTVLSIKREQAMSDDWRCFCFLPSVKVYNKYKAEVADKSAEQCNDIHDYLVQGIEGNDASAVTYDTSWVADKSGEIYIGISNSWMEECGVYSNSDYEIKRVEEKKKKNKAFYDVTIVVEGEGVEDQKPAKTEKKEMAEKKVATTGDEDEEKEKKSKVGLYVIIALVAFLGLMILIVVVVIVVAKSNKNKKTKSSVDSNKMTSTASLSADKTDKSTTTSSEEKNEEGKFCTGCGAKISGEGKFCSGCGKEIGK